MTRSDIDTFEVTELENILDDELECEGFGHPYNECGHAQGLPVTHVVVSECCGRRVLQCSGWVSYLATEPFISLVCMGCGYRATLNEVRSWLIPI